MKNRTIGALALLLAASCGGEHIDKALPAPVVCVTDAAVFVACDGLLHDYAIEYASPDQADINARICHAGETDAGPPCPSGSDCEVLYPGLDRMDDGFCR